MNRPSPGATIPPTETAAPTPLDGDLSAACPAAWGNFFRAVLDAYDVVIQRRAAKQAQATNEQTAQEVSFL